MHAILATLVSGRSLAVVLALAAGGCRGDGPLTSSANGDARARDGAVEPGANDAAVTDVPDVPCADCDPYVITVLPIDRGVALALDGAGFAYVGPLYGDAIYKVALVPGATPTVLYRSPGRDIAAIEVTGDRMRWSSNAAGAIYEAPLAGTGPIRVVADGLPGIWGFASNADAIVWTDLDGAAPGMVWRTPPAGPGVGLGQDPASRMAVAVLRDGPDGDLLVSDRTARVLRIPAAGGAPRPWVELPARRESHGLAQDATHVYVETLVSNEIFRVDRRTGALARFARTERTPAAIAVDATTVYWIDYTSPVTLRAKRKPLSAPATAARPAP